MLLNLLVCGVVQAIAELKQNLKTFSPTYQAGLIHMVELSIARRELRSLFHKDSERDAVIHYQFTNLPRRQLADLPNITPLAKHSWQHGNGLDVTLDQGGSSSELTANSKKPGDLAFV